MLMYVFECGCENVKYAPKNNEENGAKLCPRCHKGLKQLKIKCEDCGTWFYCSKFASKKIRCKECQKSHETEKKRVTRKLDGTNIMQAVDDMYDMTLEEISKKLHISSERVRVIQNTAARKFKENFLKLYKESPF